MATGLVSRFAESDQFNAHAFYLLGLIETGIRDQIVSVSNQKVTHHRLGLLFQIASCLAMGAYLRGNVVWFGWPRPDRTAFLPALKKAFRRFGCHKVLEHVPPGYPAKLKDAGIDIVAWIDFGDLRGARVLVFGQVASGYDWIEKTLLGYVKKMANWFMPPAPTHIRPAILIPFPIHHHLEEDSSTAWLDNAHGTMLYHASDFGVIFDRFRVASFASRALTLSPEEKSKIDGFDQLPQIEEWVGAVLEELRAAA